MTFSAAIPIQRLQTALLVPKVRNRVLASLTVVGLCVPLTLIDQSPAGAAGAVSQSKGTFLGGSVAGTSLDNIAQLTSAATTNTGGAASTDVNPLTVSALSAITIPLGNGLNLLAPNGVLALGAVNQYSQSSPDGSSRAASGAVTDSGSVAVGGSADFPADATFSLAGLIGPGLAGTLADVELTTGALSGTATETAAGAQSGGYQIAGLKLKLTSPALADVTSGLRTTLGNLQPVLDALPTALSTALPVPGLVSVTGVPTLTTLVDALGTITSADGSITASLTDGTVSIDLAKVLAAAGLDLNHLDPNTQLLPYVTDALTSQLLPAVQSALTGLVGDLTDAIDGIHATVLGNPIDAGILKNALDTTITKVVTPVQSLVGNVGANVVTPLATGLESLLSVKANVQENNAGTFTERALQVGLLPDTSPALAVVNLASASVGPNAGPAATVAPTTTDLTPKEGPTAGGTTVTVTGSDFVPGATSVTIGGNTVAAADVTVNNAGTSLTFVTPAHAAGPVGVTVTTPAGTSTPALGYTYVPAPTVTGIDPTHGPEVGGTLVTLTGTGFVTGNTTVTIGGTTVGATVTSPTSLTFTTPPHAAGPVTVTATTPGGTSGPQGYTYDPTAGATPTTSGIDPSHGPEAGGTPVTLTGTGFVAGSTTVTIGGNTVAATVTSSTSLTFTTPPHVAGPVTVVATTAGGTSNSQNYTYDPAAGTAPTTTGIDPTHGPEAGGTVVTLTGTGFVGGATSVVIGGTTVVATVSSPTELTFVTPPHAAGGVNVAVTTPNGTSGPQAYTYDPAASGPSGPGTPTTSTIDPDHGPVAGGTTVTLGGTGFVDGSTTVTIGGTTIPAGDVTVVSSTELTFVTPSHPAGAVSVTVTTPAGTSGGQTYTYVDDAGTDPDAPVITDPTDGSSTSDPTPVISGTGGPGNTVTVTEGGTTLCTATVNQAGTWSCTSSTLSDGTHTVSATQTTPAGRTSATSQSVTFTVGSAGTTGSSGTTTGGSGLAVTGLAVVSMVVYALVLAAAGLLFLSIGRKRTTR